MPKRKPFVEKKNSIAFRLVHRSQRDPLIATDDGELVLAPIDGVEKLTITESSSSKQQQQILNPRQRKEEQAKYGVYFEDDYDYLQHLKDVNEVYSLEPVKERFRVSADGIAIDAGKDIVTPSTSGIQLPSRLFESRGVELKVGLLNQAAPCPGPHPELDPDIVEALDDDSYNFDDPENQLEDDFILKANAPDPKTLETLRTKLESSDDDEEDEEYEDDDESSNLSDRHYDSYEDDDREFEEEETKSRFTNYSLTSSVMRRSKGLQQVDAMFEKMYEQYDDEEIGNLDVIEEEITGFIDPDGQRMRDLVEEYEDDKQMKEKISEMIINEKDGVLINDNMNKVDFDEELEKVYVDERPKEKWDCESVLSTYSTLYNRPTVISEPKKRLKKIRLDPKTGLPRGVLKGSTLAPVLKQLDDDEAMSVDSVAKSKASTIRSKLETPEQKRLRKNMIKTERRERRTERKANKLAFKNEEKRRYIVQLNLQHNLSGVKLL